jgi:hypothetical protein
VTAGWLRERCLPAGLAELTQGAQLGLQVAEPFVCARAVSVNGAGSENGVGSVGSVGTVGSVGGAAAAKGMAPLWEQ